MGAPAKHDLGHRATAKHLCQETKQGKEGEAQLRPSNSHSRGKEEANNLCLSPSEARKARPGIQPKSLLLQQHPGKKQTCPSNPSVPTLTSQGLTEGAGSRVCNWEPRRWLNHLH